jgi:hypothetical protein
MNKEEIIDKYVKEITIRMDNMPTMFAKTTLADRRHMENGFRFAVMSSIEVLKTLLDNGAASQTTLTPQASKSTEQPKKGKIAFDGARFGRDVMDFLGGGGK